MEGEVCFHQKFGFCKFKEMCSKQHLEETCQELSACQKPNNCHKRHPKECKRYEKGFCRFGIGCAYSHQEKSTLKAGNKEINVKVEMLKKMMFEILKRQKIPKKKRSRKKFQFLNLELKLGTLYQLKLNPR